MTREEMIAEYLARKGATRCPTAAVAPTSATLAVAATAPAPEAPPSWRKARRFSFRGTAKGGRRNTTGKWSFGPA